MANLKKSLKFWYIKYLNNFFFIISWNFKIIADKNLLKIIIK